MYGRNGEMPLAESAAARTVPERIRSGRTPPPSRKACSMVSREAARAGASIAGAELLHRGELDCRFPSTSVAQDPHGSPFPLREEHVLRLIS
jgi:hypothetical protein